MPNRVQATVIMAGNACQRRCHRRYMWIHQRHLVSEMPWRAPLPLEAVV